MTAKKPFARLRTPSLAATVSLVAILALAGPAAAHHGRHHHHHHHHHFDRHFGDGDDAAGTIASFNPSTGKLTIELTGGDPVTGLVTPFTWIDCGCDHSDCTSEDLVAGTVVEEADLKLKGGRAFFERVELDR